MKLFDLKGAALAPLLVAMLLLGAAGSAPALAGETGEVAFRSRVGDLGMNTPYIEAGKSFDDVVEAVLPGLLHEPPLELGIVARAEASLDTPDAALQSDISAWKADDEAWILDNFAAGDRTPLKEFLANPDMRAANSRRFADIESTFIWSTVRHGDYALVLFTQGQGENRARGLVATFIEEGGGWRRTNALSADETMDIVWAAFRAGEMERR